jgi:hydrogenase nickel incorporation protein HypA/HybF
LLKLLVLYLAWLVWLYFLYKDYLKMHELSIAQSIIQVVEKSLPNDFSDTVSAVHLSIGRLSGIEVEALTFAFSIIRKDSRLHTAELNIDLINGTAICNSCMQEFECNEFGKACPSCKGYSVRIIGGKDMKVQRISVEDNNK